MFIKRCVWMMVLVFMTGLLQGCFHSASPEADLILKEHPLAGKIWDVKRQAFITQEQLQQALLASDYLLLGETHDNIRHHQLQARVIAALATLQRPVRVYFEMIDEEQGQQLAEASPRDVEQLVEILEQGDPGWDYRHMYRVVFEQVWQLGFEIRAANLPRDRVLEVMRQGEPAIPGRLQRFMENTVLDDVQLAAMEAEAIEAHCNMMPESMIGAMVLGQRVRDAGLALNLIQDDGNAINVLLTGSGHARKDRGVPLYLRSADAGQASILSLGLMEVMEDADAPVDYMERWGGHLPFDYVRFTPRFDRPDPCEGLQRHMDNRP